LQISGPDVRGEAGRRPRRRADDVVLAVEGIFDLPAATRAAKAARVQAARGHVTIDLRRARIEDVALAALVREVAGRPIAILGLSQHHVRLLRYLEGVGSEDRA
jgi:hypothetical protein